MDLLSRNGSYLYFFFKKMLHLFIMAKVKTSSLLAEIRGTLGGTVFSSNGAGFYCKSLVLPTQPRTSRQSVPRSNFADFARRWGALTPTQIATWQTFAARSDNIRYDWFGDPYYPTAYQQFQGINGTRALLPTTYTPNAPVNNKPAALPSMTVYLDFQADVSQSYMDNNAAFDSSITYVYSSFKFWYSIARFTPPRPLDVFPLTPAAGFGPVYIQTALEDRYGDMPPDGRWYGMLAPVSNEFRIGTAKIFEGRNKETVTV